MIGRCTAYDKHILAFLRWSMYKDHSACAIAGVNGSGRLLSSACLFTSRCRIAQRSISTNVKGGEPLARYVQIRVATAVDLKRTS